MAQIKINIVTAWAVVDSVAIALQVTFAKRRHVARQFILFLIPLHWQLHARRRLNKVIHLLVEFPKKVLGPWNCDCNWHKRRTRSYVSLFVLTDLDKTQRCAETVISLRYRDGSLIEERTHHDHIVDIECLSEPLHSISFNYHVKQQNRTKVASAPRSVVIPTCSLREPSENGTS